MDKTVWRINLKSSAVEGADPRTFCINNNIVGIGWGIGDIKVSNWDEEYYEKAKQIYYENNGIKLNGSRSWKRATNAMWYMKKGDLIWTRDTKGIYYLGEITGDLRYDNSRDNLHNDIVNVRDCKWVKIGVVDSVPGKVVNTFRASGTVQRINENSVLKYSEAAYREKSGQQVNIAINKDDLFTYISADDCENILGLYLQKEKGYYLIPKTAKNDTMKYEYVLINEKGEKAIAQVKQMKNNLDISNFSDIADKVFIFVTEGNLDSSSEDSSIVNMSKEELLDFTMNNKNILPDTVKFWLRYMA